jgi:hypothetical protein
MNEKRCVRCDEVKPINCFYRSKKNKDGYQAYCSECDKETNRERMARCREDKTVYRTRNKYKIDNKKKSVKESKKRYNEKNSHKIKAWSELHKAIARNELPSAKELVCRWCEQPASEYHHYKGYSKDNWLSVIPLCTDCHGMAHWRKDNDSTKTQRNRVQK